MWGKGVADHLGRGIAAAIKLESIASAKRLKQSSLHQRNRTILLWMQKAALTGVNAATCYGRRQIVPRHTTVDVLEAIEFAVAKQMQFFRPSPPASAIPGDSTDTCQGL